MSRTGLIPRFSEDHSLPLPSPGRREQFLPAIHLLQPIMKCSIRLKSVICSIEFLVFESAGPNRLQPSRITTLDCFLKSSLL